MPTTARPAMSPTSPLVANNITALERALVVIEHLPDAVFTDKSEASFSASVGEHFRHIIEHYRMFLSGWPDGFVDYDRRPRNAQLETDMASARAGIRDLCRCLRALPDDIDLTRPLEVCCCTGTGEEPPVPSCVGRELVFLHSHSVHHFALIVILLEQRGITAEQNFGLAPSTLAHRGVSPRLRAGGGQ